MTISIALCTYNGAAYLPAQLASIRKQSRLPDELVICDDRSSDATADIVEQFARTVPFPVRWQVNAQNLGSTRNFEQAIRRCTGDFIFLCDQDDVWKPEKLQRFETGLQKSPNIGLVASDLEVVGSDLNPLGYRMWENLPFTPKMQSRMEAGRACQQLLRYNVVTGAATAFRSDLRDLILPIPSCWVHDGWIAFLAAAVSSLCFIREPLTLYRQHNTQQIGTRPLSLARQITFARLRSASYFGVIADCFETLADRLALHQGRLRDPAIVAASRQRARHARVQQRMREGSRLARVLPAVGELLRGNYHRFGLGMKAFAADIAL